MAVAPCASGQRIPFGTAGIYFLPLLTMERKLETSEQRIARVRKLIDDNQPIRVLPRRFTNHMLERWYQESPQPKSGIPDKNYDRTAGVLFLIGLFANVLIQYLH